MRFLRHSQRLRLARLAIIVAVSLGALCLVSAVVKRSKTPNLLQASTAYPTAVRNPDRSRRRPPDTSDLYEVEKLGTNTEAVSGEPISQAVREVVSQEVKEHVTTRVPTRVPRPPVALKELLMTPQTLPSKSSPQGLIELSIVIALRPPQSVDPLLARLRPTLISRQTEVIIAIGRWTGGQHPDSEKLSAVAGTRVSIVVANVTAPWRHAPLASRLEAGLRAATGIEVLFLSADLGADASMVENLFTVRGDESALGCTTVRQEGRRRLVVQQGILGRTVFPNLGVEFLRRRHDRDFDNAPDETGVGKIEALAPSLACFMAKRADLERAGGFEAIAVADDAVGDGFPQTSEARERWGHHLDEQFANLEIAVASTELHELSQLSSTSKDLVRNIAVLVEEITTLANRIGRPPKRVLVTLDPNYQQVPVEERVSKAAKNLLRAMQLIKDMIATNDRPIDNIAVDLAARIESLTNKSCAVSRASVATVVCNHAHLCQLELLTAEFVASPRYSRKFARLVQDKSSHGVPLHIFTVGTSSRLPQSARYPHDQWLTLETKFDHRHLTLDADCIALADAVAGAPRFLSEVPLSAIKARFCGLLAVYQIGGIYRDLDVIHGTVPLLSWLNMTRNVLVRMSSPSETAGESQADLSFFAARRKQQCIRRAIYAACTNARQAIDRREQISTASFATWVSPSLARCGANEAFIDPASFQLPRLEHVHASMAWSSDRTYKSRLSERENGGASIPLRRIVFSDFSVSRRNTESREAWNIEEPNVLDVAVSDSQCRTMLMTRWRNVAAAVEMIPHALRGHICGLAAVHALGGFFMMPYDRPKTPLEELATSTDFIAVMPSDGEQSTWNTNASFLISTRSFAGVPNSKCALQILDSIDSNIALRKAASSTAVSLAEFVGPGAVGIAFKLCPQRSVQLLKDQFVQRPVLLGDILPPWSNNATIPPQILVVRTAATPVSDHMKQQWSLEEPQLAHISVSDNECSILALRYSSKLKKMFSKLPVYSMRSDVCKLLAVYFYGGIQLSGSVEWARPLREWFDFRKQLVVVAAGATSYETSFIAAAKLNPCIRRALDTLENLNAASPAATILSQASASGLLASAHSCVADLVSGDVATVFDGQKFAENVHVQQQADPLIEVAQRNSLIVTAKWQLRVTGLPAPNVASAEATRILDGWKESENQMAHVVYHMQDCIIALRADGDHVAWLANHVSNLPVAFQRMICKVAVARLRGAVYVDPELEWRGSMLNWLQMDKPVVFLSDSSGRIRTEAFAISPMHDCGLIMLKVFQSRISAMLTQKDTYYVDQSTFDAAVGSTALADALVTCRIPAVPSAAEFDRCVSRDERLEGLPSKIPPVRLMFSKVDHIPGTESIVDNVFEIEEPKSLRRSMQSYFSCRDHIGRWNHLSDRFSQLPHRMLVPICAAAITFVFGGFFFDQRTVRLQPLNSWIPLEADIVFSANDKKREVHPWFFGATREHPCIGRLLDVMNFRVGRTKNLSTLSAAQESFVAGPRAYFHGLASCAAANLELDGSEAGVAYVAEPTIEHKPHLPVAIPEVLYSIWKTSALEGVARIIDEEWRVNEADFQRHIVTDDECRTLAGRFSSSAFLAQYDALPLAIMRADVCRILVIYEHGGIYADLDVAPLKRLSSFLDLKADIVFGNSTEEATPVFANWFFAAKPRHKCMRKVLEVMTNRTVPTAVITAVRNGPDFLHYVTGRGAFTDGLMACGAMPMLSSDQLRRGVINHMFNSHSFEDTDAWTKARAALGIM